MLPNFVHIGVPKSGSGTISNILRMHPQVYTPRPKELNFFNDDQKFQKGLDWYQSTYFELVDSQSIICDNSIGYSTGLAPLAIQRIREALGSEVKILLTLRHPVDRAYSQFRMAKFKGQFERMEFVDAVRDALSIAGSFDVSELPRVHSGGYYSSARDMSIFRYCVYLAPGNYADLLNKCWEMFGRDNVLVMFTEDLSTDLPLSVARLCSFLGIDSIEVDPNLRKNEGVTLRFPWYRNGINRIYRVGVVRWLLNNAISTTELSALRRYIMSWNYRKDDHAPVADGAACELLQQYYLDQTLELQILTQRDLTDWLNMYSQPSINE